MELLTHTKRRDFKNCNRYYYHRHIEHLQPRAQKRGRRRGTIFGDCLLVAQQAWEGGATLGESIEQAQDHCDSMTDTFMESGLPADTMMELDLDAVKIKEILSAYLFKYGIDKRREIEFDYPFVNPRTGRSSRAFRLAGKIDGMVVLREKHARIIEDKFVQQVQKVMIDRLPLDDQMTEYADALLSKGWTCEIEYRHTRFPSINPKPAKEFKTKDNYPGETYEEFAERLREDIDERPEFYFDKQDLIFPIDHLEDYRKGRWQIGQQILRQRRMGDFQEAFPMNPSRCWEYGGCEFIPLCTKLPDARDLYEVAPDNPELRERRAEGVTAEYATIEN